MTGDRRVLVFADRPALVESVASRFLSKVQDLLAERELVHVALTGGTVGIAVLAAVAASPVRTSLDWSRVHFWWGDERWVPAGDAERNDVQAFEALLAKLGLEADQLHPFATSDEGLTLEEAADSAAEELARFGTDSQPFPTFDLVFLGVGPDGHVASLFPHRSGIQVTDRTVIPVRNSPKPPPERLSLTRPVLNGADRIWLVLAGADKASALGLALAGASRDEVPVAGVKGRLRTVYFVDAEAAVEVPAELIASEY
ncbi:6-phosphogluconolactonase [Agromyces seonyuensis]|uniref:6-phosphogluconolactonase n=1 Tax=Agromyces seonyuensis TaxID=2662446 RepID=A0A6I4NSD1_9MICO|nr:6-phosphogluconolactonase [Agromyces seonyuensis]MWB97070.1 6-phosphogluconolactonase [Agromyces seonyuensis]